MGASPPETPRGFTSPPGTCRGQKWRQRHEADDLRPKQAPRCLVGASLLLAGLWGFGFGFWGFGVLGWLLMPGGGLMPRFSGTKVSL